MNRAPKRSFVLAAVAWCTLLAGAARADVTVGTGDGVLLGFGARGGVSSLHVGDRALPLNLSAGGFWVTPVHAPDGTPGKRVRLEAMPAVEGGTVVLRGTLTDPALQMTARLTGGEDVIEASLDFQATTTHDQAFTVEFVLPLVPEAGWLWDQDLEHSEALVKEETFANWSRLGSANDIRVNRLPFSAVSAGEVGVSLAVPMHAPRVFRTSFEPQGYMVAFDLALTQATTKFPGQASARFILYRNHPSSTPRQGALRSAAHRYYGFFPELFLKRVAKEGSWGHFLGSVTSVPDLDDFGAVFTGTGQVTLTEEQYRFVKANGMKVAKHREPWAWWHLVYYSDDYRTDDPSSWRDYFLPLSEQELHEPPADRRGRRRGPRPQQPSVDEELALIRHQATAPVEVLDGNNQIRGPLAEVAQAAQRCFIHDADGKPLRVNWNGWRQSWHSQFPMNVDPDIPLPNREDCARKYQFQNMARWDDPDAFPVEGISWDSLTNWTGFRYEDFNRANFAYVDEPLTFNRSTGRPVAIKGFHDFEMAQAWASETRARGTFIRANTDLQPWLFCGQFIELMGIERSADDVDDEEMSLIRALCFRKVASYYRPVSESGLRRSLFYGVHPGGLQVLRSSETAEAARPLFRKYVPFIRTIAQAGWQPVTGAVDLAGIAKVERWGRAGATTYFTVRSEGDVGGLVRVAASKSVSGGSVTVEELVENRPVAVAQDGDRLVLELAIEAGETLLIRLKGSAQSRPSPTPGG